MIFQFYEIFLLVFVLKLYLDLDFDKLINVYTIVSYNCENVDK